MIFELKGDIGIFNGVFGLFVDRYIAHRPLIGTFFSDQFGNGLWFVTQISLSQDIHIMTHIGIDQIVRNHGVKDGSMNRHTVLLQYLDIVFEIVSYFFDGWTMKKRREIGEFGFTGRAIFGERKVIARPFFPTKSNANEFGREFVKPCGFCIKANRFLLQQPLQ